MMVKRLCFLIFFVLAQTLASTSYGVTDQCIKLDIDHWDDVNACGPSTEPNFTCFLISDSGSEVNGVIIDLGGNIDSLRRDRPAGMWYEGVYWRRCYEDIYRDFIFGVYPSGVTITLWELGAGRECEITIYAFDHYSASEDANRIANWTANDANLLTTNFNGGTTNWPGYEGSGDEEMHAFTGTATADANFGRIILESTIDPCSLEGEPFAFVNALVVVPSGDFIPVKYAHRPVPFDGQEDTPVDVVLSWIPAGAFTPTHDIYLGTDEAAVTDANRSNPLGVLVSQDHSTTTYNPPGSLDLNTTYYWRIDEVNDPNIWKGEVWSFRTSPYFVVENFDSYEDDYALRNVWKDYTTNGTGAEVSVETAIVRDGNSMRYRYKNNLPPYYSEAYMDINDLGIYDPNWLGIGAKALELYFYGEPDNPTGEQMYVKLTDGDIPANTATFNCEDMDYIKVQHWFKWNIALTEFNDVNLANVARITIGFGDGNGPGDEGTAYFEDIQIVNQVGEGLPILPDIKGDWIGTWASGQQLVEPQNNPASPYLANNTLRQIVHATLGGSIIRVQFSNKYTTSGGPVTINSAHIALSNSGIPINSSIDTATDTALTFWGSPSVTIPAGEEIYSDPVDFNVPPLSNLVVSIYFGSVSSTNVTGHPGSRTSYYIKTGNTVSDAEMESGYKAKHWYILSRIDLLLDDSYRCVVTLGDSITDGRGCTDNYNNRWPDKLASRLQADANTVKVGVINEGIGGNCVVSGGLGPTALARFDHDVLEQPGVRWVMIFEGINDIGGAWDSSVVTDLTDAYQEFIDKAHANGILVYGVPITPFKGSAYANENPDRLTYRNSVNNWIRTIGEFDAVIDFDPVVWDSADHEKLNTAYLYQNDYLHINATGYQAMVDSIDLGLFDLISNLNEDGIVNLVDFAILAGQWLQEPGLPSADIVPLQGGDGVVDFEDLHLMTQEWLIEE